MTNARAQTLLQKFLAALDECWRNREVMQRVYHDLPRLIARIQRQEATDQDFKKETYGAVIRKKGRDHDGGNFFYAVMLHFLWKHMLDHNRRQLVELITDHWPSTELHAEYTEGSIEKKGDIVEFIFNYVRETGPAVEPQQRRDRKRALDLLGTIEEIHIELDKILFESCDGGPPKVRERSTPYAEYYFYMLASAVQEGTLPRELFIQTCQPYRYITSREHCTASSDLCQNRERIFMTLTQAR